MTNDQADHRCAAVPVTKQIPNPKSEIPNPQSEIRNPQSATAGASRTQPQPSPQSEIPNPPSSRPRKRHRLGPARPPSERLCRIYLLVAEEGIKQKEVGARFRIRQSRVSRIVDQVEQWMTVTGGAPRGYTPEQRLRLCILRERRKLNRLLHDVELMSQQAGQPYESATKIHKVDGNDEVAWTIIRREPPRVGTANVECRILNRLTTLGQAECGIANQNPQSAIGNPQSGPAPTPHAPSTPPNWLEYPTCPPALTYAEEDAENEAAKRGKRTTYRSGRRVGSDGTPDFWERYWRYQALGIRQDLANNDRQRFVETLLALDKLARQAEGMAWAELLGGPVVAGSGSGSEGAGPAYSLAECRALRCVYFDRLLEFDFRYSPDQRQAILARYDPDTGTLAWWQPGRIDLGDEDLVWLMLPRDRADVQRKEAPPKEMSKDENQMPKEIPNPQSEIPNPQSGTPSGSGARQGGDRGGQVPLPAPAAFTPGQRRYLLSLPGARRVAAARLAGYYLTGAELKDMPIDQEQVVIYQVVEEVAKEDCGLRISDCGLEEMSQDVPNPQSAIRNPQSPPAANPQSAICNPQSPAAANPQSPPPSPLTPALRDELFAQVGPEGVAVFGLDGALYTGPSLAACGLSHRGTLFLRELAHSLPSWGESPWKNFQPKPRPK